MFGTFQPQSFPAQATPSLYPSTPYVTPELAQSMTQPPQLMQQPQQFVPTQIMPAVTPQVPTQM